MNVIYTVGDSVVLIGIAMIFIALMVSAVIAIRAQRELPEKDERKKPTF